MAISGTGAVSDICGVYPAESTAYRPGVVRAAVLATQAYSCFGSNLDDPVFEQFTLRSPHP